MTDLKQLFWDKGTLYVVTGFNQSIPARETALAQRLQDRWKTEFELSQLMIKGGYILTSKP